MENELQPITPLDQPISPAPTPTPALPRPNGYKTALSVVLGLIVIAGSIFAGIQIGKKQTSYREPVIVQPSISPSQVLTISPTKTIVTSTPTPTSSPTPTTTQTPTPTPRPFSEEEKLLRKTLAGFEMYIGNGNTAGALTFFTPPQTVKAKEKYDSIRMKNLSFTLKSWSFIENSSYQLVTEEIKGGYRVRMNECRTNSTSCSLLFIELFRSDVAENGFLIDRYYDTTYSNQNNLGEEIKYQGFGQ